MSLLAVVLGSVIFLALFHVAKAGGLAAVELRFADVRPALLAARFAAIVTVIAFWPALIRFAASYDYVSAASALALQAARWRCALWLLSLEVLIGLNGIETLAKTVRAILP